MAARKKTAASAARKRKTAEPAPGEGEVVSAPASGEETGAEQPGASDDLAGSEPVGEDAPAPAVDPLDRFFAGIKTTASPPSGEGGVNESSPGARSADVTAEASASSTSPPAEGGEPSGVIEIELPSGIQVYYQEAPKRLYRIRQLLQPDAEAFDWVEVPSMSKIPDILDKPGLVHWAEKIGINMIQELLRNHWVSPEDITKFVQNEDKWPPWFSGAHLQEIGKQKKLTNYYMKDAAAGRGTSVHKALEGWAMSGQLVDPDVFAEEERGYVIGLNTFLRESKIEPLMSEVIVASVEHRVAGRFDLLGKIPEPVELVYHLTKPRENGKRRLVEPSGPNGDIIDLKTTSGVFEDHHLQVAGYKGVMNESGYPEAERGFVLRVTAKGNYEFVPITAEWLDFWWLKGLYDALQLMEARRKESA